MPDWMNVELSPTRLCIFALDSRTGAPVTRLPVYAEVVWTDREQLPPPDGRFNSWVARALTIRDVVCSGSPSCVAKVTDALSNALTAVWPQSLRDELAQDNELLVDILAEAIHDAKKKENVDTLDSVPSDKLAAVLEAALREVTEGRQLPVNPVRVLSEVRATHPLGTLASDHVGYVSFDLTPLPLPVLNSLVDGIQSLRGDPQATSAAAIWVYPLSPGFHRFEALEQRRYAHDAIVMRMPVVAPAMPDVLRNLGLLAMQNPGLTDWRVSPTSFAGNPGALVGQDGCETLLPANLALQEFEFYQVIRLKDVSPEPAHERVRLGVVHEFRHTWYPLGHSLGQILYSLPLAPGESVNLAVIDWTRHDEAGRTEDTKLNEQMVHDQRRERTIAETVRAAVNEYQSGSSFMAGLAQSAGIAGTIGKFGVASGLAGSLGGSSSDSSGSRDLAGDTVQKLSENITQASTAMRELQSTVVVRSTQAEREAIETRTVANYNHSHTLTILYYEVLRHFRTVTRLARRRPAVLVKMRTNWFSDVDARTNIVENRSLIESALLKPRLVENLNALERILHRQRLPGPATPADPGDRELMFFEFEMTSGGMVTNPESESERIEVRARLLGLQPIQLKSGTGSDSLSPAGAFSHQNSGNPFVAMLPAGMSSVKWKDITAVEVAIHLHSIDDASFQRIKITARATDGSAILLVDQDYNLVGHLVLHQHTVLPLPARRPPAAPASVTETAEEAEDNARLHELLNHLLYHSAYYGRVLTLGQSASERARELDAIVLSDGSTVLDHVENRPLEVIGDYVAFPCSDVKWSKLIKDAFVRRQVEEVPSDERLVTLPTRGVFADGRLGHCNLSEEIDNTRFWDWQQSPIPHFAAQIMPVQAVVPKSEKQDTSPTPFPGSLVNIVNPPSAPDPAGLGAALSAITTPNIFRDMSGRAEVAQLLQKLSDNTIGIAQAASSARGILSKQATSAASGQTGLATTGGGIASSGTRAIGGAQQPMSPAEQHDRIQVVRNAEAKGNVSPAQRDEKINKILDAGMPVGDKPKVTLSENSPEARAFFPPDSLGGETVLVLKVENATVKSLRGTWLQRALDVTAKGSFELDSIGSTGVRLLAMHPGLCGIEYTSSTEFGAEENFSDAVSISVPLFVEVFATAADLTAVFAAWHIPNRIDKVLSLAESVAKSIGAVANLRFVCTAIAGPARRTLPDHYQPGGKAASFLTRVGLAGTSASGNFADMQTTANYPASLEYNGTAVLNLSHLIDATYGAGAALGALVTKLGSAVEPQPAIEEFVAGFVGRILGSAVLRTTCGLVLGKAIAGDPPTLAELTGFDLPQGADAGDPASYVDRGIEAMRLRPTTVKLLEEHFPAPPVFK